MTDNVNADSVPKYSDLLNPTLAALHALGGSASTREIVNQVIEDMGLSTAIVQVPYKQGTSLEYRLGWARSYLKKYG
ncbi:MAG: restriction endonuclease, partial [Gemmatimonadetes bacterium]|nr:restriction endonuclease [Gemmatimonadota bacterium]